MVTPSYHPIKGGTETVVRNLSIVLNKKNVHTDIMTFNMDRKWNPRWRGKIEKTDEITVFKIPGLNWLPITHSNRNTFGVNLIPGRFTNILKCYDVIHFHSLDCSFPLFSSLVRKPKILHVHGIDVFTSYPLNRIILKHITDLYISISRQMTKHLASLGIPKNKIAYLPNAVDTSIFTPQGQKEDNLLLFVGRITFNKGLHVLLESLSYLKNSVRLIIIGPSEWDLKYHQDMLKLMEKENQKGKHEIRYLGAMEQADVIKWYQKASIFILPSFAEGFPVTILEALSSETPVIATSVGGIPEVVKNHENGILVSLNDSTSLAEAIQYLLQNEEIRIKFGHEGRERAIKDYSLEAVAGKLCKIYKKLIDS